ncbi:hypothetical protein [Opitutus sp. ER46]|uniref:hypothetical protein n=1 Tax=Opitutus sp. ER46 TaxID=2161864 RepID=UPI000D309F62|nr:hypothetical protein [Opitutus sp. ER46]PTX91735.1 hypothetical protein DB354_17900 [Opitutus sp. ER46]
MNRRLSSVLAVLAGALTVAPVAFAAKPPADIPSVEQRRAIVQRAEKLARALPPAPLPPELVSPFSPPGFDRPEASEVSRPDGRAAAAPDASAGAQPAAPALPQTDRDLLAAVAAKIPTTGTIIMGGRPLLISGTNRIEVGSLFTVVYSGQEYELELVAVDRTTFTVRYKGEEFTRPIKLGKSP